MALVKTHVRDGNLVKHMLATEAIMRTLARTLDEDPDLWGLAGLLHDLDYELTADQPDRHGFLTEELLASRDVPASVLQAIRVHVGGERKCAMDKALYAADRLTGLIVAAALIHPGRRLGAVDAAFVLHRYEETRFAPAVDRKGIAACRELGFSLEEFVHLGVEAMQGVSDDLGL